MIKKCENIKVKKYSRIEKLISNEFKCSNCIRASYHQTSVLDEPLKEKRYFRGSFFTIKVGTGLRHSKIVLCSVCYRKFIEDLTNEYIRVLDKE